MKREILIKLLPKKKEKWRIIGKHKWVVGCMITESQFEPKCSAKEVYVRFTAIIRGWRNFMIYQGILKENTPERVKNKVMKIRDKIDSGTELKKI